MPFLDQAADSAERVDAVFLFILALCAAFLIFITALMVFFVIRYSKKRHPKARDIHGHTGLEIAWTLIPLALFLAMFWFGWTNFEYLRNAPRDAFPIKVTGLQWRWLFEYPNGKQTEELYLPIGKPVRLDIRSADVIHGFYVPAFRIKMDAVPGKENWTWFTPTQHGSFDIECSVICGTDHTYMLSKAHVVPQEEFEAWYFGGDEAPPPTVAASEARRELPPSHPAIPILQEKQCLACHSTDGTVMVGPTFKGAFGSTEVVLAGGTEREIVVDEEYLRRSISDPMAEILKGYPPTMPATPLSESDMKAVVDYIRSLE